MSNENKTIGNEATALNKAGEALPSRDERYHTLLQTAMDGFCLVDIRGCLLDVNATYCQMSGYSKQELLAMSIYDLEANETAEETAAHIRQVMIQGENRFISQHRRKDGDCFDVEISVQYRPANGGQFVCFLRDITERKRAEEALRESTEKFISLADNVPGHVAYVNANTLHYQYVNSAFEKSFGIPKDKIIGSHIKALLGESNYQHALSYIEEVRSGKSVSYENTFTLASGKRWIRVNYNPVFDTNGQVVSIAVLSYDITERKQAEEALIKNRSLLTETESIGKVGGWEFNIDTKKQIWTKGVYDIHEVDCEYAPIVSEGLNFYAPASRPIIAAAVQDAIEHGKPFDLELEIITAKGNSRCVHAIGEADLKNRRVFGFFQDITERKRAEESLSKVNRELDAFAYTVSHDLRTPLTAIIGYAEILYENYKGQLDDRALGFLSQIISSGEDMQRLTEDLLSLASLGQFKGLATALDAGDVAKNVVRDLAEQLSFSGVTVKLGTLPLVTLQRTLLFQVFYNLISNAMKYGSKPGDVIEVGGERRGERVFLYVRDHGPGIPTDERDGIFEVFFRGKASKDIQGTGIGLATVQKIAGILDGKVWVEETPGGGSTFWLDIAHAPASNPVT